MDDLNLDSWDDYVKAELRAYYGVETDAEVRERIADLATSKHPFLQLVPRTGEKALAEEACVSASSSHRRA